MTRRELYNKDIAGEKIRRWQRESGLQGQEIAKMVGISAPYYSDIRKGKQRGSIPVLAKIADVLGRSVEDLLTDQNTSQETLQVAELRKALQPIFKSETDDIIEGIQLWRRAPHNFKAAFRSLLDG